MPANSVLNLSDQCRSVAITLTGGKVTAGFRSSLFTAANKSGMSVNEYVLLAAAEKLKASGIDFPGLFEIGDIHGPPADE